MGAMTCVAPCQSGGMSGSQFYGDYGVQARWASGALGIPIGLIVTQWFVESGKGSVDICSTNYANGHNNPANYNNLEVFQDICTGVNDGYILPMSSTSGSYAFVPSNGNGRTAAQYVMDAYNAGSFTIPSSDRYGPLPGAGTVITGSFHAACAAMGSMGWAQSRYNANPSGSYPNVPGNVLMNYYDLYLASVIDTSSKGLNTVPSCCGWPSPV